MPSMVFQFLIGRLNIELEKPEQKKESAFQFLIGRLNITNTFPLTIPLYSFQFLIGRLNIINLLVKQTILECVSIPYR